MSQWVGVLLGGGRKAYVAGGILQVVDSLSEARRYENPDVARIDAISLKDAVRIRDEDGSRVRRHAWITEVDVEQVRETA